MAYMYIYPSVRLSIHVTVTIVVPTRLRNSNTHADSRLFFSASAARSFTRILGYCEQNDIHSPQVTVHESLLFSSWLRLAPEIDSKTKKVTFANESLNTILLLLIDS